MFDQITSSAGGRARGLSSMLVSVIAHGGIVSAGLGVAYCRAHAPRSEEPVAVTFRPPPPPPPPPAGHRAHPFRETPRRPIAPKLTPAALVQPRQLPALEQQARAAEPEEDDEAEDAGVEGGVANGVIGLTAGGVTGGVSGGTAVGGTLGGTGAGEESAVLFGAGMTQPRPTADCRPEKPTTPEQALQMGITGTVLVAWTVHADGRVDNIVLKNPGGSPILFEAVKKWLAACPFSPGMVGDRPAPITLVRPFIFTQK